MIDDLERKLNENKVKLLELIEVYNRNINEYRGYGIYINSQTVEKNASHLINLSKEMFKVETQIDLLHNLISETKNFNIKKSIS